MIVDGVQYEVKWSDFKQGLSLTFPCLDPEKTAAEVRAVTDQLGYKVVTKAVILDGIRALRVWRIC